MRFATVLEEIVATPSYLFALFLVLTAAFHIVFVWWLKQSDTFWKKVDYVWLSTAALGLLASAATADKFLSARYYENLEAPRAEAAYRLLLVYVESGGGPGSSLGMAHGRTALSPPDFDAIENARRDLNQHLQSLLANLPPSITAPYPSLKELGFSLPALSESYVGPYISDLQKIADEYEFRRLKANALQATSEMSFGDQAILMLGPLLLAIALALRITKVSGELANAARKEAAKPTADASISESAKE